MMKKTMLTALVTMLAFPMAVDAQNQNSQVTATATVAGYMDISGTGDLPFGTLSRATDNVISAIDGTTTRDLSFNRDITVTFSNVPTELVGSDPANTLPVELTCAWEMSGTWSTPVVCGSQTFDLDVGTGLTAGTLGFGGTITAVDASAAVADSYSATLDIRVDARS
jgi:hypothetical protein